MKIKYNFGIGERCITPCPFSERNSEGIVSVGSFGCKLCKHHVRDNFPNEKSVECKHPVGKGASRLAFALRAVLSGICIGIGGAAYLSLGGKWGAVLFAFGLLTIVHYKLPLYTGMAGFFDYRDSSRWLELPLVVALNGIGCLLTALLAGFDGSDIIFSRIEAGYLACLCRGILCGTIMTLVVGAARQRNTLPLIWGVTAFIVCGFYHSIADCFYMFSSLADSSLVIDYLPYWGIIILGNLIGCNVPRLLQTK